MGSSGVPSSDHRARVVRFGRFEFDAGRLLLTRDGRDLGLQQQPAFLLTYLVAKPGMLVSREELRNAIWPAGTYVEFDQGLNTAMNRLRHALRDSASEPTYIATVPKQGYRFIAPIELVSVAGEDAAMPLYRPKARQWRALYWGTTGTVGVAAIAVLGAFSFTGGRAKPEPAGAVVRSYVDLPAGHKPEVVVISPAGDQIVYQAKREGARRLYRRYLNEDEAHPLAQSDGGTQPFFSPDGKHIGFYTRSSIRVEDANEGAPRDLVAVRPDFDLRKAIWGEDGMIYFTTPDRGIWRVAAEGQKAPELFLEPPASPARPFYFPQQWLAGPQGGLLYSTNNGPSHRWIALAHSGAKSDVLVERAMGGRVLPSGELIYYWHGKLYAAPYDGGSGRLLGSGVEVLTDVAENGWRGPNASVSNNGTLVYLERQAPRRRLVWVDRKGQETPLAIPEAAFEQAEISPEGRRIALVRQDHPGLWSLWVLDLRSGGWTHILDQEMPAPRCVWSGDGKALFVAAALGDAEFVNLYRIPLTDPVHLERLTEEARYGQFPGSWSSRDSTLLFTEGVHDGTASDIAALKVGGTPTLRSMVSTAGVDRTPAFSPDGGWFAYSSDTPGGPAVFVQPFETSAPARQVSSDGGSDPAWSPDGKWLYFLSRSHALMEVSWTPEGRYSAPRERFAAPFAEPRDWWTRAYAIAPDGRFLVIRQDRGEKAEGRIRVVVNWPKELKEWHAGRLRR